MSGVAGNQVDCQFTRTDALRQSIKDSQPLHETPALGVTWLKTGWTRPPDTQMNMFLKRRHGRSTHVPEVVDREHEGKRCGTGHVANDDQAVAPPFACQHHVRRHVVGMTRYD